MADAFFLNGLNAPTHFRNVFSAIPGIPRTIQAVSAERVKTPISSRFSATLVQPDPHRLPPTKKLFAKNIPRRIAALPSDRIDAAGPTPGQADTWQAASTTAHGSPTTNR
jgi:hypothetical protein